MRSRRESKRWPLAFGRSPRVQLKNPNVTMQWLPKRRYGNQ